MNIEVNKVFEGKYTILEENSAKNSTYFKNNL